MQISPPCGQQAIIDLAFGFQNKKITITASYFLSTTAVLGQTNEISYQTCQWDAHPLDGCWQEKHTGIPSLTSERLEQGYLTCPFLFDELTLMRCWGMGVFPPFIILGFPPSFKEFRLRQQRFTDDCNHHYLSFQS